MTLVLSTVSAATSLTCSSSKVCALPSGFMVSGWALLLPAVVLATPYSDAGYSLTVTLVLPTVTLGTPYSDAGTPYSDAGTPYSDAGTPYSDAGYSLQ